MNKTIISIIIIVLVLGGFVYFYNKEGTSVYTPAPVPAPEPVPAPAITYMNATIDNIRVELPFPGAVVGKEFSVIGEARGSWYFEASFPVTVLDKDGNKLVATYAQAQGEWMTPDFVPFKGNVKISSAYIGPATLILQKDNPSDMRQYDASISFPITIEY
ncbi:MAG TPA: Gmad2 immunoglobulin-like domain-containing protein [Candidatus Paceibacterota bacterium]